MTDERVGNWMQTYSGAAFWPLDPRPDEVFIDDIAHSLSMQCRYNGHTSTFYSVAEHSYLMSTAVPEASALKALLHDSAEAYVGDMVRPLKRSLPFFSTIEDRILEAIADRFGIEGHIYDPHVANADSRILLTEKDTLMSESPHPWGYEGVLEPLDVPIHGWDPQTAENMFFRRFYELKG